MDQILLPVTLVTAGAAALINVWLGVRIGAIRRLEKISIGDGGNLALIARMRAQANFVENAPFILLLIGLIELCRGPSLWLWIAGVAFLLARIAHALGMDGLRAGRMIGTSVSMLLLVGLGLYAVLLPFTASRHVVTAPAETIVPNG